VNGASSYLVQRSTDGVNWVQVANATCTCGSFTDDGVVANTGYYYRVAAWNGGGVSAYSVPVQTVTPKLLVPAAPSNLVATRVGKGKIGLKWVDNATNETGFRIEYSTDGVKWSVLTNVGADVTAYTAGGLRKGRTYHFRICVTNAARNSAYCAAASATAGTKAGAQSFATVPAGPVSFSTSFSTSRIGSMNLQTEDPTTLTTKKVKVF
jgi:hypothetical protein